MNTDRSKAIGCLYIRPTHSPNHDCHIDLWFTDSHRLADPTFREWLDQWLQKTWGFKAIAYPGKNISWSSFYRQNQSGKRFKDLVPGG